MFLLFQNWGSYGSPAKFSVLSLVDLLAVTLLFGGWVFCGVLVFCCFGDVGGAFVYFLF